MKNEQQLAEVYGGPHEAPKSLFATIEDGVNINPNAISTISMHQPLDLFSDLAGEDDSKDRHPRNDECLIWTYAQLHRAAVKFAAGLMAHGVEPGMSIATLFPNGVQFQLTLYMSIILRLTVCPLDPGAVSEARKEELSKYMSLTQLDVLFVADEKAAEAVDVVLEKEPKVKIIMDPAFTPKTTSTWTSLLKLAGPASLSKAEEAKLLSDARDHDDPNRICSILFTSGTSSGNPKGCPRHVRSTTHHLTAQVYGRGLDRSSRILQSSMNFRGIATSVTTQAWRHGGVTIISDPSAGIKGQIDAVRKHGVTYILFIPALLHAMITHPEFKDLDKSSVRDAQIGGDMVTREILEKARQAFPDAEVANGHGMTEGGGIFKWPFWSTSLSQLPLQGEIIPIGLVTRGARLRIRDPETGSTKLRNEPGELCINCESIIKNYVDNVQPEAFYVDEGGRQWFRTGDLAVIDQNGVVTIIGRLKDVVKRAGVPLAPAAIESCVQKFTGGAQVSVVALPHPTLGAEPLVVLDDLKGKTEEEIKAEVLSRFNEAYTIDKVVTLKDLGLDDFPLNTTGKIMKIELVKKAQEVFGSSKGPAG